MAGRTGTVTAVLPERKPTQVAAGGTHPELALPVVSSAAYAPGSRGGFA